LPKEIIIIFQNHVKTEKQVFFIKKKKLSAKQKTLRRKKRKKNKENEIKRSHPTRPLLVRF
jgi:hypothetical protein